MLSINQAYVQQFTAEHKISQGFAKMHDHPHANAWSWYTMFYFYVPSKPSFTVVNK